MTRIHRYQNGRLESGETEVVREFPLKLVVNHREVATLICSPHDLRFLAAGFLRLQGFVKTVDDFLMLSVCEDFGVASIGIRGEVPEKLKPVLTSGCGAGISFASVKADGSPTISRCPSRRCFTASEIFAMMERLARLAENYRTHGGIHSAAVGDGTTVLLYSEDLGRHNTLDRIAGEALLKGIDLSGTMLLTSGRVSTEMAAKAAELGICMIVSRTSPTDMAVRMCEEAGISLVGYARAGRFTVYAGPDWIVPSDRMEIPLSGRRIGRFAEPSLDGAVSSGT